MFTTEYDVIVVGGGHAGAEAAAAAANMGASTLLITMNLQHIAQMSCNPAVGGIAKGQIVREIDALGGYMGIITDKTAIQFKMLNQSKGPAMWSPRAQSDRMRFSEAWRLQLESLPTLDFFQGMVNDLLIEKDKVVGVRTSLGITIKAKSVVLTNGTFLNGVMHIGMKQFGGGRAGEPAAYGITECLVQHGFEAGRMKTGTPPRVDARSLDFSKMIPQPGDEQPQKFSFSAETQPLAVQKDCYMTYTSERVHNILRTGFDRSPMFQGIIHGVGPRYCPSIEDKIYRYPDKNQHHLFLEREGYETNEIYLGGMSSSLPVDVQEEMIKNLQGFENAKIMRYAYAIEYDYVPPEEIKYTLESRSIDNLFLAGQINGTSGYEEAGAQGLMAGINAVRKLRNEEPIILDRADSYIGTLIDDLVSKGTNEPYRMFTARSEYRLYLREDNADLRLSKIGYELGLIPEEEYQRVEKKRKDVELITEILTKTSVGPSNPRVNEILLKRGENPIKDGSTLLELLRRPEVTFKDIEYISEEIKGVDLQGYDHDTTYQVEITVKYQGYINRALKMIEKHKSMENKKIPADIDYDDLKTIPKEAKDKLKRIKPINIGQASRISGVSPADIQAILIYLKMRGN